jgi:hypothetical protein
MQIGYNGVTTIGKQKNSKKMQVADDLGSHKRQAEVRLVSLHTRQSHL